MTDKTLPHPAIVSQGEWRAAREALLVQEKQATRAYDALNAGRRRLPMVEIDKDYGFDGLAGQVSLLDLFDGHRQLIVYHFMFDPDWDAGCAGCTGFVNALGDLTLLGERDTALVLVSRAPLAKLDAYQQAQGWRLPWVSSHGSDFNYDFHVTRDAAITPPEYNYRAQGDDIIGEAHGLSVFFRIDDKVYHSYSTYARGCESLTDAYRLLDCTPYGRQEDFEDSPAGWPQRPTYG